MRSASPTAAMSEVQVEMKELSLHIQDIAENSIRAGAECIEITILEMPERDRMEITITDDGEGMGTEMIKQVLDPFFTTKTVRRVGMGLSIFKQAAEQAGGDFEILSTPGKGTRVTASFQMTHIDRQPLGDLAATIVSLLLSNQEIDIVFRHDISEDLFIFDTRVIKCTLDGVSISEPEVLHFIRQVIQERQNL